jgi:hypothetical protein
MERLAVFIFFFILIEEFYREVTEISVVQNIVTTYEATF